MKFNFNLQSHLFPQTIFFNFNFFLLSVIIKKEMFHKSSHSEKKHRERGTEFHNLSLHTKAY